MATSSPWALAFVARLLSQWFASSAPRAPGRVLGRSEDDRLALGQGRVLPRGRLPVPRSVQAEDRPDAPVQIQAARETPVCFAGLPAASKPSRGAFSFMSVSLVLTLPDRSPRRLAGQSRKAPGPAQRAARRSTETSENNGEIAAQRVPEPTRADVPKTASGCARRRMAGSPALALRVLRWRWRWRWRWRCLRWRWRCAWRCELQTWVGRFRSDHGAILGVQERRRCNRHLGRIGGRVPSESSLVNRSLPISCVLISHNSFMGPSQHRHALLPPANNNPTAGPGVGAAAGPSERRQERRRGACGPPGSRHCSKSRCTSRPIPVEASPVRGQGASAPWPIPPLERRPGMQRFNLAGVVLVAAVLLALFLNWRGPHPAPAQRGDEKIGPFAGLPSFNPGPVIAGRPTEQHKAEVHENKPTPAASPSPVPARNPQQEAFKPSVRSRQREYGCSYIATP